MSSLHHGQKWSISEIIELHPIVEEFSLPQNGPALLFDLLSDTMSDEVDDDELGSPNVIGNGKRSNDRSRDERVVQRAADGQKGGRWASDRHRAVRNCDLQKEI